MLKDAPLVFVFLLLSQEISSLISKGSIFLHRNCFAHFSYNSLDFLKIFEFKCLSFHKWLDFSSLFNSCSNQFSLLFGNSFWENNSMLFLALSHLFLLISVLGFCFLIELFLLLFEEFLLPSMRLSFLFSLNFTFKCLYVVIFL